MFTGVQRRLLEAGDWAGAITAGSGFPSGNAARGLDAGRATPYAFLNTTWTTETLQIQTTIGAIRNAAIGDGRAWLAHISAATLWKPQRGLQVGVDVIADQNPNKPMKQWPTAALVGAIYSATNFLDLDLGYQRALNRSAPDNQYLFGATFRW